MRLLGRGQVLADGQCHHHAGNYIHDNADPGSGSTRPTPASTSRATTSADNWGEGVPAYEVSYNAKITDNTFVGNAWGEVQTNSAPSFTVGAIFISNSEGDSRVASNVPGGDPHFG